MINQQLIKKEEKCKWCGMPLSMSAPHYEDGNSFCCLSCAQDWRSSNNPINKIYIEG